MSFSRLERKIAAQLSKFPKCKQGLKRSYQWVNWLFFRHRKPWVTNHSLELAVPGSRLETFFGYYDEAIENRGGSHFLVHEYDASTKRRPVPGGNVTIHVIEKQTGEPVCSFSSKAFNFQQGAKARWLDDSTFCFNDYCSETDRYVSRIFKVNGEECAKTEMPVYDAFGKDFYVSLSFERLSVLRPDYGYFAHKRDIDIFDVENDGIWKCSFEGGEELICNLHRLINFSSRDSMRDAVHKVNHLSINPVGEKLIFLHRWFTQGGERGDRLMTLNMDGSGLKLLVDQGMVSHCAWLNDTEVVCYCRNNSHGDAHYRVNTVTGDLTLLSNKLLGFGDGHQSIKNNKMIFDSYPNRARMKRLFLYCFDTDQVSEIASFYEPMAYNLETRCDLHPRWSDDGKAVYIDSVHAGRRQLWRLIL